MYQCIECEQFFEQKDGDHSVVYDEEVIIDGHKQDKFAVCGDCNGSN